MKTSEVRRRAVRSKEERHVRVSELQRARLLAATVLAVDELGYSRTTVTEIVSRAGVSRRTFYALFPDRDGCMKAVFDSLVESVEGELSSLGLEALSWQERIRTGLWTILSFLDREQALARVCIVQAAQGGAIVLERQESILTDLIAAVDSGRHEAEAEGVAPTPLTAEILVCAAMRLVYSRLLARSREPLVDLLPELMCMIALPYLGWSEAGRERERPLPTIDAPSKPRTSVVRFNPLAGTGIRLTYRTTRVLEAIDADPGANNRAVAGRAGIADDGQVSKLLSRLERHGLIANGYEGQPKWATNAWSLTDRGREVVQSVGLQESRGASSGALQAV